MIIVYIRNSYITGARDVAMAFIAPKQYSTAAVFKKATPLVDIIT